MTLPKKKKEAKKEAKKPDEPKLRPDQRFCFKCKDIVDVKEFNAYYGICHECVNKSGSHS